MRFEEEGSIRGLNLFTLRGGQAATVRPCVCGLHSDCFWAVFLKPLSKAVVNCSGKFCSALRRTFNVLSRQQAERH